MDKYDELLLNGEYSNVESEIKEKLEEDNEDSRLWYLLFLSQNNNYTNLNFDNINNEIAFNKAIEYASITEETMYKIEFQLYKNLSKYQGLDLLFRYYQYEQYDKCLLTLIDILNREYVEQQINKKKLAESVEYIFGKIKSVEQINLQLIISNILYILTKDEVYINIIQSIKENGLYSNSTLNPYGVRDSFKELKELLSNIKFVKSESEIKEEEKKKIIINKEDKNKFEERLASAKEGNSFSQNEIGDAYYKGLGVEKNYTEASNWYRLAAERGNSEAQYNLGMCYELGTGVLQDKAEAIEWYKKSASNGYFLAQYILGIINYNEKNYKVAYSWFKSAAEQGHVKAQLSLGDCYFLGEGVTKSYTEASKWYRKSADSGDSDAQNKLGDCYYNGVGMPHSFSEAVKWYRLSAEQGNMNGQKNLGNCYYTGHGIRQNYTEAVNWYTLAALQGHAGAKNNLGVCYYNGRGVQQDYNKAFMYYLGAANLGNVSGMINVANCYRDGRGVNKNSKMFKHYIELAKQKVVK